MSKRALLVFATTVASTYLATTPVAAQTKPATSRVPVKQTITTVEIDDSNDYFDDDVAERTLPASGGSTGSGSNPNTKDAAPKAGTTPVPAGAGSELSIVCPVAVAKFTNDYGAPRGSRSHAGIDMLAPRGTPVLAPAAGAVSHKWSSLGGLSFYLDLPGGEQFFGTHLQATGASGNVKAGDVIGYVGDTGNARGTPHLHFEYHPTKRTKANPYSMLMRACRGA